MPLQKRPAVEQQPRRFGRGPQRGKSTGTGQGCAAPHRPSTASSTRTRGDRTPVGLSRRRVSGEGQVSSANHQRIGPGEGGEGGRAGQRQKAAQPLGPASPPRRGRCRRPPQRRPLGRLQPLARPDPAPSPSRDRQPRRRARPLPPCGRPTSAAADSSLSGRRSCPRPWPWPCPRPAALGILLRPPRPLTARLGSATPLPRARLSREQQQRRRQQRESAAPVLSRELSRYRRAVPEGGRGRGEGGWRAALSGGLPPSTAASGPRGASRPSLRQVRLPLAALASPRLSRPAAAQMVIVSPNGRRPDEARRLRFCPGAEAKAAVPQRSWVRSSLALLRSRACYGLR